MSELNKQLLETIDDRIEGTYGHEDAANECEKITLQSQIDLLNEFDLGRSNLAQQLSGQAAIEEKEYTDNEKLNILIAYLAIKQSEINELKSQTQQPLSDEDAWKWTDELVLEFAVRSHLPKREIRELYTILAKIRYFMPCDSTGHPDNINIKL